VSALNFLPEIVQIFDLVLAMVFGFSKLIIDLIIVIIR
jgi:hypothetical protein